MQTQAAIASSAFGTQPRFLFYNKPNKIVEKLNNNVFTKEMKKQTSEKIVHKIDVYLIKNNITTMKLCATQTLLSKNVVI